MTVSIGWWPAAGVPGRRSARPTYDGLDRQASVTTGGQLRRVRYSGTEDGVLAEEDATPAKTARYLLGPDGAAL